MKASITYFPWLDPKYDTKSLAQMTKVGSCQTGQCSARCPVGAAGFFERDVDQWILQCKAVSEQGAL